MPPISEFPVDSLRMAGHHFRYGCLGIRFRGDRDRIAPILWRWGVSL